MAENTPGISQSTPLASSETTQAPMKVSLINVLNRLLLLLCFLLLFVLILSAFSFKLETANILIPIIVFASAFLAFLFPGVKKINEHPWLQSVWTTVTLFICILIVSNVFTFLIIRNPFLLTGVTATATPTPTAPPTVTMPLPTVQPAPIQAGVLSGVSLVSASYTYNGEGPGVIDFRKAATEGIPVSPGNSIHMFNLVVNAPESAAEMEARGQILDGNTIIAETAQMSLSKGINTLPDPTPINFIDDAQEKTWQVRAGLQEIKIRILLKRGGNAVEQIDNAVKFSGQWTENWLISPPTASIIAIGYTVGDGPMVWVDMRDAETGGLFAYEGKLTIREVWYQARYESTGHQLRLESYLHKDSAFVDGSYRESAYQQFQKSAHPLTLTNNDNFSWTIDWNDKTDEFEQNELGMVLVREDGVVLDRLHLPITARGYSNILPADQAFGISPEYGVFDNFENNDDHLSYSRPDGKFPGRSWVTRTLSGFKSLYVPVMNDKEYAFLNITKLPKNPRMVMGMILWPKVEGQSLQWAKICTGQGDCAPLPVQTGQWVPFAFDISQYTEKDGSKLDLSLIDSLHVEGQVMGATQENEYYFLIDDLIVFGNQ